MENKFQYHIFIEDDDEDEIEVNKQITIIKTAPKKDNQFSNKKKHDKNKNKRAHFSKKVQAEMREQERQTEAMLEGSKNQQVENEEDSMSTAVAASPRWASILHSRSTTRSASLSA